MILVEPGGGHNSPNFAWLGLYCTVNFVEKCFLMTELVSQSTVGLILSTSICTVLCGQLILIFLNNEILQCQKLCKQRCFGFRNFYITYEKSGQNKLSGRQNTQFLYAVNILTKIVIETKIAKYSEMVQFPLYLQ